MSPRLFVKDQAARCNHMRCHQHEADVKNRLWHQDDPNKRLYEQAEVLKPKPEALSTIPRNPKP